MSSRFVNNEEKRLSNCAADMLMQCVVQAAKLADLAVVALCPYAVSWLQRQKKTSGPRALNPQ